MGEQYDESGGRDGWVIAGLEKRISELEARVEPLQPFKERILELEAENTRLKKTIYELQMADPHLEFISRVQDAGLHQEWSDFCDKLTELEQDDGN